MASKKILVVEDYTTMGDFIVMTLDRKEYVVEAVENGSQAFEKVKAAFFDLIVIDIRLPDMSGIDVLKEVKRISPDTEAVMITAHATVDSAVKAKRIGAFDYITKPFLPDELENIVDRALKKQRSSSVYIPSIIYPPKPKDKPIRYLKNFSAIFGPSKAMRNVYDTIEKVSSRKAPVLIRGETGTGKKLVAQAIHSKSPRKDKPFIKFFCAELQEELMGSDLSFHKKGDFSGVITLIKSKLELAHGGTLLFDQIEMLPMAFQSTLVSLLEEILDRNPGKSPSQNLDVRIIATTTKDLRREVEHGNFYENLFYRLNVVQIYLPPLRVRKEDILYLAYHFLQKYAEEYKRSIQGIDDDALEILMVQEWKENTRELEYIIEGTVILCRDKMLGVRHFQFDRVDQEAWKEPLEKKLLGIHAGMTLRETEKCLIMGTLEACNNNKSRAAQVLGISVQSLRNKLKEDFPY